jgi:RNA polymerase sigma factor (sigma-70 family)
LASHTWKVISMEHAEAAGASAISLSLDTFSTLAHRYTQPLYTFLTGLVRDPELARDLLQDAFCAAWDAAQRGTPPFVADGDQTAMRRWLYRVAYRRMIDTQRRSQVIRWESLDALQVNEAPHADPAASFEDLIAESEAMGRALAVLHMEDVACLLLMVVQGFTAQEAAAVVGSTPAAMGKRVGRAKRRLLTVYQAQNASVPAATTEGQI